MKPWDKEGHFSIRHLKGLRGFAIVEDPAQPFEGCENKKPISTPRVSKQTAGLELANPFRIAQSKTFAADKK